MFGKRVIMSLPLTGYNVPEFCDIFAAIIQQLQRRDDERDEIDSLFDFETDIEEDNFETHMFKAKMDAFSCFYKHAIHHNNMSIIEWLISVKCPLNLSVITDALKRSGGKRTDVIDILLSSDGGGRELFTRGEDLFSSMAAIGDVETLKTLDRNFYNNKAARFAALYGQLDVLKWFDEQEFDFDSEVACIAAFRGNLEMLKFLFDKGHCHDYAKIDKYAAKGGHLNTLEFLPQKTAKTIEKCALETIAEGHLKLLKSDFFKEKLNRGDCNFINTASRFGRLEIIEYLHKKRFSWNTTACLEAGAQGHLDCLTYLHEHGCPWNSLAMQRTAQRHKLECLIYLFDNGCPFNAQEICVDAAEGGDLNCLMVAHRHGGILTEKVCNRAITWSQSIDCLKYAIENGCPYDKEKLEERAKRSNSKILEYIQTL